jgi:hypothetical protein
VIDGIEIRPYRPGDEAGLVACYNRVFPDQAAAILPQDAALWDWKFARNPTGRIEIVVGEHETEGIVGAYPCQPVRVWLDGETRWSAQIVDLMVRPEFRRRGGRPGLFVQLGRRFYGLYCGRQPERQGFNYGWPVPAWRVGQRYLDYLNIRDWNVLFAEVPDSAARLHAAPADLEVVAVDRFGADCDALFEQVKIGIGLTLVKDSSYLNWRFGEHPSGRYRLWECRDRRGGALRAVAVYTVGDFLRRNTSFLVDWLVPGDDRDALQAIVAAAERQAFRDETGVLAGIWSPIDPRFHVLQRMGYLLMDSTYFVVVATFDRDTSFFRDHWIFTIGDSDLI